MCDAQGGDMKENCGENFSPVQLRSSSLPIPGLSSLQDTDACLALPLLSPALSSLRGRRELLWCLDISTEAEVVCQQLPTKDSTLLITPPDPCKQNRKAQMMLSVS